MLPTDQISLPDTLGLSGWRDGEVYFYCLNASLPHWEDCIQQIITHCFLQIETAATKAQPDPVKCTTDVFHIVAVMGRFIKFLTKVAQPIRSVSVTLNARWSCPTFTRNLLSESPHLLWVVCFQGLHFSPLTFRRREKTVLPALFKCFRKGFGQFEKLHVERISRKNMFEWSKDHCTMHGAFDLDAQRRQGAICKCVCVCDALQAKKNKCFASFQCIWEGSIHERAKLIWLRFQRPSRRVYACAMRDAH